MFLCPNCREGHPDLSMRCQLCGWCAEVNDGILVALSNADRRDDFFKGYVENYHQLSLTDMENAIVEKSYQPGGEDAGLLRG